MLSKTLDFPTPGSHPCGLAWDGSHLWYSDGEQHRLHQLDRSGYLVKSLHCRDVQTGLAWAENRLWQVSGRPRSLVEMMPDNGRIVERHALLPKGEWACGVDIRDGYLYVAVKEDAEIQVRDLGTGEVKETSPGHASPGGLTLAGDTLWYADNEEGNLVRINLDDGTRKDFHIGGSPTGLTFDGEALWVNDYAGRSVSRYEITGPA